MPQNAQEIGAQECDRQVEAEEDGGVGSHLEQVNRSRGHSRRQSYNQNVVRQEVTDTAPGVHTQNLVATIKAYQEREKAFQKEIGRLNERLAHQEDLAQSIKDENVEHSIQEKKRTILLKHQIQELTQQLQHAEKAI